MIIIIIIFIISIIIFIIINSICLLIFAIFENYRGMQYNTKLCNPCRPIKSMPLTVN